MSNLLTLPNELLLEVLKAYDHQFTEDSTDRNTHFIAIMLTCTRLRVVAEEVFYRKVCMPLPRSVDLPEQKSLAPLLRTLLQRPALATFIEEVEVNVFERYINHSDSCNDYMESGQGDCCCGWQQVQDAVTPISAGTFGHHWRMNLLLGWEASLLAFMITLTPNQQDLAVHYFQDSEINEDNGEVCLISGELDLNKAFGIHDQAYTVNPILFTGLQKLETLRINTTATWPIVSFPAIKHLQISFYVEQDGVKPWSLLPQNVFNSTITKLTINAYLDLFEPIPAPVCIRQFLYLDACVGKLSGLEVINARVSDADDEDLVYGEEWVLADGWNLRTIVGDIWTRLH